MTSQTQSQRTSRSTSRSTRVSNSSTRTASRSRPAFQSVQHVGLQTERRQATENDADQTALHFNTDQFRNETSIGDMIQCQHCQAMKFRDESKGMCCSNGKVNPEPFPLLPQQLAVLFEGTADQSVRFLQDIRKYDSAFQLTSLGCKEVRINGWPLKNAVCRISEFHKAYDSLQYPILFPHGSDSWNLIMKITG